MAIVDADGLAYGGPRTRMPNVDRPVIQPDPSCPTGRSFQSETWKTKLPHRPHILPNAKSRQSGFDTLISVNVEPTESSFPDLGNQHPYESTIQYFNKTNRRIRVTDKHNLSFTLPKTRYWNHNQTEYFVVRKIHRFSDSEVAMSLLYNNQIEQRYLSVNDDERKQVLDKIDDMSRIGALRNQQATFEITIDRIIPIALFLEAAAIYVSDLDLQFSMEDVDVGSPHPTSQDAVLQGEILNRIGDRRVTGAFFEIVDNQSHLTSRYICLGKQTVQIPLIRDPSRTSGVYHSTIDNINTDRLRISMSQCPLDQAEKLGIYTTKEEAETRGHVNEAHKVEIARLTRDRERFEADAKRISIEREQILEDLQHERKMRETEATMAAKAEQDRLDRESSRRKDEYDERAHKRKDHYDQKASFRKDTSEFIKWAPAIVTGIIGVAAAIAHHRKTVVKVVDQVSKFV